MRIRLWILDRFPWQFCLALALGLTMTSSHANGELLRKQFRPHDIILISLHCHLCWLIEGEERAPVSHMGLVLEDPDAPGKLQVLEAWGEVKLTPLETFIGRKRKRTPVYRLRSKEWKSSAPGHLDGLWNLVKNEYLGLPYDEEFLWDNYQGRQEKLYCSELVTKIYNRFADFKMPTKRMHYLFYRKYWKQYFEKLNPPTAIPDGLPGNSPGDFFRSELFEKTTLNL